MSQLALHQIRDIPAALDFAVARATENVIAQRQIANRPRDYVFRFSSDPAYADPLIAQERIRLTPPLPTDGKPNWQATIDVSDVTVSQEAATREAAAALAVVAGYLGDSVEIPDEILADDEAQALLAPVM